jgi:pimeloyl-ACP methyl ester carboxylesterase
MNKYILRALPLSIASALSMSVSVLGQDMKIDIAPVSGGSTAGKIGKDSPLGRDVDPNSRKTSFTVINKGNSNGKTWVVIPGLNDNSPSSKSGSLYDLAKTIQTKNPNDRILMLDWSEASNNNGEANIPVANINRGSYYAATWIRPVAEAAVAKLKEIDGGSFGQNINLVGHSLGSILSTEIGAEYKKNNGFGVNSIIALDPPSESNLNIPTKGDLGSYDVDGRTPAYIPGIGKQAQQTCKNTPTLCKNIDAPQNFKDNAKFSISFVGSISLAGNQKLAATANESYQMNFGDIADTGSEHTRVVESLNNLIKSNGLSDSPQRSSGTDRKYFTLDNLTGKVPMNVYQDQYSKIHEGIIDINSSNQAERFRYYQDSSYERTVGKLTGIETAGKTKDETLQTLSGSNCDPYSAGTWIAWILSLGSIKACAAEASAENQNLSAQLQNQLMLNNINGITQWNVSSIGSPSTSFISHNPIVDVSKPRPENIQEKNQYTNGTIVKAPLDIGLTWNQSTNLDLDSHTVTPSGDHIYYPDSQRGSLTNSPNTFLYRDSIPGTNRVGAEQTRISSFQEGEYRFYVYNFSDQGNLFPSGLPNSAAKVQLFQGGAPLSNIPNDPTVFDLTNPELQKVGQPYPGTNTFNVPTGQSGNIWYVFKLNTRTGILNRVDRIGNINSSTNVPTFK